MRHDINHIAKNHRFNKTQFKEFALKHESKYGIINENGFITTSTWFSDALVRDFKATQCTVRYLQPEDVYGLRHMGWRSRVESPQSGAIIWEAINSDYVIYATPNWNKDGETPFTIRHETDDSPDKVVINLYLSKDNTVEQQKAFYLAILKTVIETL